MIRSLSCEKFHVHSARANREVWSSAFSVHPLLICRDGHSAQEKDVCVMNCSLHLATEKVFGLMKTVMEINLLRSNLCTISDFVFFLTWHGRDISFSFSLGNSQRIDATTDAQTRTHTAQTHHTSFIHLSVS